MNWSLTTRAKAALQALIRRRIWQMDIGAGCRIHPTALIDRTWPAGIHIGAGCTIDQEAVLLAHDFTRGLLVDTRIGARCRIGARAIVMPGVTIGDDCRVAPGALVNRDMPAGSSAIGNPATITPISAT